MTNLFDTHKFVTQSFLLYGSLDDHIVCGDLVLRSFEQYLAKLLKSRGYEHIIFYGDALTKGAYVLDPESARFFFPESRSIPIKERQDVTEDGTIETDSSISVPEVRGSQESDTQMPESAHGTSLGGMVGRRRRRHDRYQPGADPTHTEARTEPTTAEAQNAEAEFPKRVRYSLRDMKLQNFFQLIDPLMLKEDSKMAVVFYNVFTSNLAALPALKDHLLYSWSDLAGKNICILMAPETNNSEAELLASIRHMGLDQKFLRDKDAHSAELDPRCCYKIGAPDRDEIKNLLRRLSIIGSKSHRRFHFDHSDLDKLADEVLFCANTVTVNGVALNGINQILPRLEEYLDGRHEGGVVELTTARIDEIWRLTKAQRKPAKMAKVSLSKHCEVDWTVKRFQTLEEGADNTPRPFEEVMNELNSLTGLENVKDQIRKRMNLLKANQQRSALGLPENETSMHMVFRGNPGTGKTTVARLIAELYYSLGLLRKKHCEEVSGKDLIAGYVGQSASQTEQVIRKALGGVLFIDEAYSLTDSGDAEFGKSVIATLVQEMENNRDDLAVIVAGYQQKMDDFLKSNDGLASRFRTYLDFNDYSLEELMNIVDNLCAEKKLVMTPEARKLVSKQLAGQMGTDGFGNGRAVRNILDDIIERQADRLAGLSDPPREVLQKITEADIPISEAEKHKKTKEELLEELNQMIGLHRVKEEIRDQMNMLQLNQAQKQNGKKVKPMSRHMVFAGAPGTGKTTAARLVGELYRAMGLLRRGQLEEVSGKDLIAGYVGQSVSKMEQELKKAAGGVLFIDEAYSITEGGDAEFGRNVISTLIQQMENARDDLVVIAAGYTEKMKQFFNINPGLKSRFGTVIHFDSYSIEELLEILDSFCREEQITLTDGAREKAREVLLAEMEEQDFGNGRNVRNLFEKMQKNRANRFSNSGRLEDVDSFLASDVPAADAGTFWRTQQR